MQKAEKSTANGDAMIPGGDVSAPSAGLCPVALRHTSLRLGVEPARLRRPQTCHQQKNTAIGGVFCW